MIAAPYTSGPDLIDEEEREIPPTFRGFSGLCEFCGHVKGVHRTRGCRPNNRLCPQKCKRFLAS